MDQDFSLNELFRAIDSKDRSHWDNLTEEQQKKHSAYLAMRWAANVSTNGDFGKYYLLSANQQANKHFWALNQHPKLQWLVTTCVSPGLGTQRREWVGMKSSKAKNPKLKLLAELNPDANSSELAILDNLTSKEELVNQLEALGWTDADIKKAFK